ncbi:collagen alpha-1(I) chain-like [Passer domesticus]|uniref:collagen alpha-1(I) chain-like n=1 Tax=Passer domesticus TaxID=48849 RepID=UPI0030FEEBF9
MQLAGHVRDASAATGSQAGANPADGAAAPPGTLPAPRGYRGKAPAAAQGERRLPGAPASSPHAAARRDFSLVSSSAACPPWRRSSCFPHGAAAAPAGLGGRGGAAVPLPAPCARACRHQHHHRSLEWLHPGSAGGSQAAPRSYQAVAGETEARRDSPHDKTGTGSPRQVNAGTDRGRLWPKTWICSGGRRPGAASQGDEDRYGRAGRTGQSPPVLGRCYHDTDPGGPLHGRAEAPTAAASVPGPGLTSVAQRAGTLGCFPTPPTPAQKGLPELPASCDGAVPTRCARHAAKLLATLGTGGWQQPVTRGRPAGDPGWMERHRNRSTAEPWQPPRHAAGTCRCHRFPAAPCAGTGNSPRVTPPAPRATCPPAPAAGGDTGAAQRSPASRAHPPPAASQISATHRSRAAKAVAAPVPVPIPLPVGRYLRATPAGGSVRSHPLPLTCAPRPSHRPVPEPGPRLRLHLPPPRPARPPAPAAAAAAAAAAGAPGSARPRLLIGQRAGGRASDWCAAPPISPAPPPSGGRGSCGPPGSAERGRGAAESEAANGGGRGSAPGPGRRARGGPAAAPAGAERGARRRARPARCGRRVPGPARHCPLRPAGTGGAGNRAREEGGGGGKNREVCTEGEFREAVRRGEVRRGGEPGSGKRAPRSGHRGAGVPGTAGMESWARRTWHGGVPGRRPASGPRLSAALERGAAAPSGVAPPQVPGRGPRATCLAAAGSREAAAAPGLTSAHPGPPAPGCERGHCPALAESVRSHRRSGAAKANTAPRRRYVSGRGGAENGTPTPSPGPGTGHLPPRLAQPPASLPRSSVPPTVHLHPRPRYRPAALGASAGRSGEPAEPAHPPRGCHRPPAASLPARPLGPSMPRSAAALAASRRARFPRGAAGGAVALTSLGGAGSGAGRGPRAQPGRRRGRKDRVVIAARGSCLQRALPAPGAEPRGRHRHA